MKPRRRTIIKIIALLAAGATLNVAVAWGCAARWDYLVRRQLHGPTYESPVRPTDREQAWLNSQFPPQYKTFSVVQRWSDTGVRSFVFFQTERNGRGRDPYEIACGLPKLCLQSQSCEWNDLAAWNDQSREWFRTQPRWFYDRYTNRLLIRPFSEVFSLPLTLIPIGFAINTLFYAGVLWMLFCGPFALRRMIRRRRGQCAHCAYPIGQNERCTECGAELR